MPAGMGTNAGDAGDQYMDAPAYPKPGDGKGIGSGWNPISAMLDLVGIHIGGDKLPGATSASAPPPNSTPVQNQPVSVSPDFSFTADSPKNDLVSQIMKGYSSPLSGN